MTTVAEPGLAVLPRRDGGADCYRAQWAGSRERLGAVCGATPPDAHAALLDSEWRYDGLVHEPVADAVDYLRTTVVYVVTSGAVRTFLPVWFGFPPTVELDPSAGILLRVHSPSEATHCRRLVRRCKQYLGPRLAAGTCSLPEAVALLSERLRCRESYGSSRLRELRGGSAPGP